MKTYDEPVASVLAGIVWTQLVVLNKIIAEDHAHETPVAPALGSYEADALSTSGWL